MIVACILCYLIAIALLFTGIAYDPTVGSTYNMGLMQVKAQLLQFSTTLFIMGTLFLIGTAITRELAQQNLRPAVAAAVAGSAPPDPATGFNTDEEKAELRAFLNEHGWWITEMRDDGTAVICNAKSRKAVRSMQQARTAVSGV
jgi:hypothetical protein